MKRAERKVLQNALKFASTARNEMNRTKTEIKADKNCDNESDKGSSSNTLEDKGPTNIDGGDVMEETASATSQLCIDGE